MRLLIAVSFLLVLSVTCFGAPIAGVTIESVSSEYLANGWDLAATHTVDGSGLSGSPATHAVIAYPGGNSWQTITQSGTGHIWFDLGDVYTLDHLHVWNLNFYAPYNRRGAKDVDIRTSLDASNWYVETYTTFPMATGADGDPGFDIDATGWNAARYVAFYIGSNHGGEDNAGHVGLSEVQFFEVTAPPNGGDVPEPATGALAAAGLAFVFAVRRLRRRS